jgi:hypothetical protein
VQVKVAVARKVDALIEEGGERLRLHRVPLEAFSTVYSSYAALAGYEGEKWKRLTSKADEDEVLRLRDSNGYTVLHWAAFDGGTPSCTGRRSLPPASRAKLAGVIAARDAGLVSATDLWGATPLHLAAMCGHEAMSPIPYTLNPKPYTLYPKH